MDLLGEFAALGTALCWSFTAIFFSYSGRLIGSDVVNRSRLVFAFVFLSVSHLILEGTLFPLEAEGFRWGWLALSSILGLVLGDTFLFRAYVLVGPRLSMLMMATVPILTTMMAWLFLDEQVNSFEALGIAVTVGGIVWVVTERRDRTALEIDRSYLKGLIFGLLGALGQATNLIAAKFALEDNFSTISATVIRIFVAMVALWMIAAARKQMGHTVKMWRNRLAFRSMLAGTISGPFLGIWLSLVAVQLARVGIASTLMALPPVILIPLGYLFYKERISRRGIAGTVVAISGVALIFSSDYLLMTISRT